ncbi:BH0509 family protein [Staphylococcus sp. Marseille-Q6910]|uniref:BH0509 family protein n=1 Tax=Staphylococcus sp. Marseille-Q6910 TaxID=2937990 RepID=UPI00203FD84E|nr:BH0509 family protein [Staphylococcus sp. Marseille-Q6910]
MSKQTLIALIDIMQGLSKEELKILNEKTVEEVETIYINVYQEQNDEQIEIAY